MKLIPNLIITILFFGIQVQAQDSLVKDVAPPPVVIPPQTAIEQINIKVLYIGLDNPLKIVVSGGSGAMVQASISQGTLTQKLDGTFIANPEKPGKAVVSVRQGLTLVREETYRVARVPDPVITLGKYLGGNIKEFRIRQQKYKRRK